MFRKALPLLGIFTLLCCVIFTAYAAFHGIVFTDDGYSLLSAKYPEDIQINYNLAYLFTSSMYFLSGDNVAYFRLITILLNLLSCGALLVAASWFINAHVLTGVTSNKIISLLLYSLLVIAGSLIYIHNMNPDYNIPVRTIAVIQAALVICLFNGKLSNKVFYVICIILGYLTGGLLLLRLPTFAFNLMVVFIAIFVTRKRFIFQGFFILGLVSFFLTLIAARLPLTDYLDILKVGMKYAAGENHSLNVIIDNLRDIINTLLDSIILFILFYLSSKYRLFIKNDNFRVAIFISMILLVAAIRFATGGGDGEVTTILAILNRAIINCVFILILNEYIRLGKYPGRLTAFLSKPRIELTIFLLLITYSVSFGTATPVFYHTVFSFPLIILALLINLIPVLNEIAIVEKFISYLNIMLLLLLLIGVSYYNAGYNDLFKQNIPYNIDNGVIYIDNDGLDDINLLKSSFAICGFKSGDYIFSFYGLPSMIYLAGGRAAVTPWHFNVSPEWNQYIVGKMSQIPSKSLFLLADKERFNQSANMGILENYTQCSEFTFTGRSKFPVGTYIIFRHK